MRLAYLVNQYPTVSHTFIRREILGLEALGISVRRFTLRPTPPENLRDPQDESERLRTEAILARGAKGLLGSVARVAAMRPQRFAHAQAVATRLGIGSDRGVLLHFAYLAEACKLLELLEAERIQHVHAHFGTNSAAVAMLVHALGGPGFSFTIHGPEEFDKPDLLHLRAKIAAARFVVGVSSFGRSQLLRQCDGRDWSKVHVIRCGVDQGYIDHEPTPVPATPRLLNIGRLSEQKGQLLLVEAAALLAKEGRSFELALVGDGPLRGEIEQLIQREGLEKHVLLLGWASGEQVQAELQRARALVLPSFAEGLPVVIMEALGSGRPVVSTYIAGIPELVETGRTGWLVPAGSTEAVAKAMRDVLDASPETLTQLGRNGYERVRELHDARKNARALLDLITRYVASDLPGEASR
jgi:colanic acid/amylovoran biosynthesis glycosyltransferase